MSISLSKFCQEWWIKKVGTFRMLRVPDHRLGGHGHSWCHGWSFLSLSKIPWKFHANIFLRSMTGMGGQEGGTWRTLRVPDGRHGGYGHPWCYGWPWWTPRIISWKFQVVIFVFCEVINDFGVNGQLQMGERDERETRGSWSKLLPCPVGWGRGEARVAQF